MRRALLVVLVVALGALIFAPAAFAQDDNPSADDLRGDDRGGEREGFDDNPSRDDLGADDNGGMRAFDDNPTGDDVSASPAATPTATPTATTSPTASAASSAPASASPAPQLPTTGGFPVLAAAVGILLVGSGIVAATVMRRSA